MTLQLTRFSRVWSRSVHSQTIETAIATFAKLVAQEVIRELRSGPSDLVSQATSPLGKRRHCAAVRARVQRGDAGGSIVGRIYYLTPAALQEELAKGRPRERKVATAPPAVGAPTDQLAELRARMGFRRG